MYFLTSISSHCSSFLANVGIKLNVKLIISHLLNQ
jgi:hypothetical protein